MGSVSGSEASLQAIQQFRRDVDRIVPPGSDDDRYSALLLRALPGDALVAQEKTIWTRIRLFIVNIFARIGVESYANEKKQYDIGKVSNLFLTTLKTVSQHPEMKDDYQQLSGHYVGLMSHYARKHFKDEQERNLFLTGPLRDLKQIQGSGASRQPPSPHRAEAEGAHLPPGHVGPPSPPSSGVRKDSASKDEFWAPFVRETVADLSPLVSLCTGPQVPIYWALKEIDDVGCWQVRRIRGDGHCLYGSVAAHLVTPGRLAALAEKIPQLQQQGLLEGLSFNPQDLIAQCRDSADSFALMRDQGVYIRWVELLRTINVNALRQGILDDQETTERIIANEARTTLGDHWKELLEEKDLPPLRDDSSNHDIAQAYLRRMLDLDSPLYGDVQDTVRIGEALGISIKYVSVTDPAALDLTQLEGEQAAGVEYDRETDSFRDTFILLYRDKHFDALCYRPPEVLS
jgi:hypothetical protein